MEKLEVFCRILMKTARIAWMRYQLDRALSKHALASDLASKYCSTNKKAYYAAWKKQSRLESKIKKLNDLLAGEEANLEALNVEFQLS